MTDAYNKIKDRLFDGITPSPYGMIDLDSAREWAEREILQLYEALEETRASMESALNVGEPHGWADITRAQRTANAAMAKARGE